MNLTHESFLQSLKDGKTEFSGSFSFDDMASFAIWIKNNFSDEIKGAFARRSDGNLYWDEQVGELLKIWYENYR